MNVSYVKRKGYEDVRLFRRGENKPKQSQFQRQKNAAAFNEVIAAHAGWQESF